MPGGPPFDFAAGLLPLRVPAGDPIVRVHETGHGPIWFGPGPNQPPKYRFDAPAGEFRTLYGAAELTGAFVETVLRRAQRIIARPFVERRQWTVLAARRDLVLAKVFDEGLVHHGVTADICAGDDYAPSRRFAAAIHAAFPEADGIAYRARHNNGQICYALFDRVAVADLKAGGSRWFSDHMTIADELLRRHGAFWDPEIPLPPV